MVSHPQRGRMAQRQTLAKGQQLSTAASWGTPADYSPLMGARHAEVSPWCNKRHAKKACLAFASCRLPGGEGELVDVYRIGRFVVIAVDLVIDGDAIPAGWGGRVIAVEISRVAVLGDGFEQQMTVRGALHLDRQMVPSVALRVARNTARNPLLLPVVPRVPLMTTGYAALMAPNVRLPAHELIDVELERLRIIGIVDPEVDVVGKVVEGRNQRFAEIWKTLRRKVSDQVIVPKDVRPLRGAAAVCGFCRNSIHGGRANIGRPGPLHP